LPQGDHSACPGLPLERGGQGRAVCLLPRHRKQAVLEGTVENRSPPARSRPTLDLAASPATKKGNKRKGRGCGPSEQGLVTNSFVGDSTPFYALHAQPAWPYTVGRPRRSTGRLY